MAVHAAVARSTSNVCLPHGWCFDGEGSLWLVMRKYARSLADRMREEPLSAEDLERYSKTLCKTMEDLERCSFPPYLSKFSFSGAQDLHIHPPGAGMPSDLGPINPAETTSSTVT